MFKRLRRYLNITIMLFAGTLLISCDSPDNKYEKYLDRGNAYYESKDYVRARLEFKNAAKIMPADPRAIYHLGLIEEVEGNLQSALSAFLVAEQQDPAFKPVLLKLAGFYLTAQRYEDVIVRLEKIFALDPNNAMAHALNGSLFLRGNVFDRAKQEVDLALQSDPSNVIAFSVLTGIHVALNQPEDALKVLQKGIKLNPEELSLRLLKASVYSEQDDVSAVAETYHNIFELYPEKISFRLDLARILSDDGRIEEAGDIYREAVREFPETPEAKRRLASFLEDQKGTEAAEKEIRSYIELEPKQKVFYLWLADLYVRNKQDERAIATLKNIISSDPDEWIGLNASTTLAGIQLGKGDMELAARLIETVLSKDVNNRDALFLRASLAFSYGDYQRAVADLRTIIRDDPGALGASRILAEALLIQGHVDLAIDMIIQALHKNPNDQGSLVRLAQLNAVQGNQEKALEILAGVTTVDPLYPIGWESLARLAIESKQWDTAEKAVEKLYDLEGQEMVSTFLKGQIADKSGHPAQAFMLYKDVIAENPSTPLAEYALSALLEISDEPSDIEAIKNFLGSLDSDSPTVTTVLGGTEAALGNMEAAEGAFRTAINQNPRNQAPYISLAQILIRQQESEEALDVLRRAEIAIPSEIKAPMMRADILISLGNVEGAIEIYEAILERNDAEDSAANNLAQTIADFKHNDDEALDQARLVAERFINSENPYYLDTLGWVYFRQGHVVQAEPILARALALLTEPNPQINYHYGALLFANGQKEDAEQYLRHAVSGPQYPGFDEAQVLLGKID